MPASFIKYNTATKAYFYIKSLTSYGVAAAGYGSYFTVWISWMVVSLLTLLAA